MTNYSLQQILNFQFDIKKDLNLKINEYISNY